MSLYCYFRPATDDETRTAIGKHAIKYGNKSAVEKYSRSLGFDLPEVTVRNFKRELEKQIKSGKRYDEARISVQKKGRHLLYLASSCNLCIWLVLHGKFIYYYCCSMRNCGLQGSVLAERVWWSY